MNTLKLFQATSNTWPYYLLKSKYSSSTWLLLVFILTCSTAFSNLAKAGTDMVLSSGRIHKSIASHSEYYEDKTSNLGLNEILSPLFQNRFTAHNRTFFRFGFTESTYWIRFHISNPTHKPKKVFLKYDNITQANIETFIFTKKLPDSNDLLIQNTIKTDSPPAVNTFTLDGNLLNKPNNFNYLPITIRPLSENTYYLRASSKNPLNFSLYLNSENQIVGQTYSMEFLLGIEVGILVFLILTIFFSSYRKKELVYFYYGCFLLTGVGYIFSISGVIEEFIPALRHYQDDFGELNMFLAIAINIAFTQRLLNTKSISPLLDQRLQIILICALFATLIPLSDSSSFSLKIGGILAIVSMVMMAYASVRGYKETPHARYYLLARSTTIIITSVAVLSVHGFVPLPYTITWLMLFALILDASIMSFALKIFVQSNEKLIRNRKIQTDILAAETHAKTEILARVSHDIRTPMSGVLGMTELLSDTILTPKQSQYLGTIKSSGQSLLDVINNIMDYSKFESDDISLLTVDFKLSELIEDCLDFFREKIEDKQLELIIYLSADTPEYVHGARERLRQILINLITNSIKTINKGNLIISISPVKKHAEQLISFDLSSDALTHSTSQINEINDLLNNKGIKLNRPQTEQEMNLIVAGQLITKMGGHVKFNSTREGTQLSFELNLPSLVKQNSSQEQWEEKLTDLRILIVDDNLTCRQVIEQQANNWGMITSTASNGMEALAKARNNSNLEEPFDIIVMDHNMPGMSGLELASKITDDPLISHNCLCIMLTGLSITPSENIAKKAGIHKVLAKPISGHTLKIAIAEELGIKEKISQQPLQNLASHIAAKNLHVLVAEDHYLSQKVIESVLGKLNIEATIVENGEEAFKAAQKQHFDVILMDCDMPTMDGFESTREIRAWEKENHLPSTPIIALTAHIVEEYKDESIKAGMNDYISKPMNQNDLELVIDKWTDKTPPPPNLSAVE